MSFLTAALICMLAAQDEEFEKLKTEVEFLRDKEVAWRGTAWKSCLLEGLRESRETKRPLLCWVFIDRPVDDERC